MIVEWLVNILGTEITWRYVSNYANNNNNNNIIEIVSVCLLLTPRIRVLLEKLAGSQLVKKFPAFYGTQRFIPTFTSARHLPLP
jgi:hypothetical protein